MNQMQPSNSEERAKKEAIEAIRGYAYVLGLQFGDPNCMQGSLSRLEETLTQMSQASDPQKANLARRTLQLMLTRESMNGTPKETNDPEQFRVLTLATGKSLEELYTALLNVPPHWDESSYLNS